MVSNNLDSSSKKMKSICSICHREIEENDLVYLSAQGEGNLRLHFRCYLEIQDKICSECGKPFQSQQELLFCEEHQEYFHSSKECLRNHMEKHMPFRKAWYDATNNRIILEEK